MSGYRPTGPLDPMAAQICAFFAQDAGWQGLRDNPIEQTRAAIRAASPATGEPAVDHVDDFRLPVPGGEILARLYRPAPVPHALLVWAHGGGFVLGSVEESDTFVRTLVLATGAAILSVDYRLAPEYRFPTQVEDVQAATLWAAARVGELAGGPVPLLLGGDSAGANLATVVTRRLHAAGTVRLAGNVLVYPCTDGPEAESLTRFQAPFMSVAEVAWFHDAYLPDAAWRSHPDFAPLHSAELHLLPPTLLLTAEHDILTEQAEAYGARLSELGVPVRAVRYPGMIHGFATLEPFFAGAAGEAMRDIAGFIRSIAS